MFTGAGISAESGLQTFRDSGGLWEEYKVVDVATPEAWHKNPRMVLEFYNKRKEQILRTQPNVAHRELVKLEEKYDVQIITQNIDDLHERAGSSRVLHLHGEIMKARSTLDPSLVYHWGDKQLNLNNLCEKGSQLRPHVVWFGESVPEMENAVRMVSEAEIFVVVGTSLVVYPAAGLMHMAPRGCRKFVIDPKKPATADEDNCEFIEATATQGVPAMVEQLLQEAQ